MAITDKKTGAWGLDQTYNKINQGSIWEYSAPSDPDKLFGWGKNAYGQLGLNQPSDTAYSSPVQIPGQYKRVFTTHYEADYHIVAGITTTGLMAWGRNYEGQLGQNDKVDYSSPVQIPGTTWYNLPNGSSRSYGNAALKTDNTLWVWGNGGNGGLGLNNTTSISSPTQLPGSWDKDKKPAVGVYAATKLAIKTDGTLWSWGYNNYGQMALPPPSGNRISSPIQIGSETDWHETGLAFFTGFGVRRS